MYLFSVNEGLQVNSLVHICDKTSTIKMAIGEDGTYLDKSNFFSIPKLFENYPTVCGTYMAVYNPIIRLIYSSQKKITVRYPLELWWWSNNNGNDDVRCLDLHKGVEMKFFYLFLPHAMKSFGEDARKLFTCILSHSLEPNNLQENNLPTFDIFKHKALISNVRENGEAFAVYQTNVCNIVVKDDPVYVKEYKIGKNKCNGEICNEIPSLLNNFQHNSWLFDSKF